MLRMFKADLHIHTCLSPCADLSMSPGAIVLKAAQKGLDVIAITDHNSAENALAVMNAARARNLTVLAGMEVTSREEVHAVGLFDGMAEALQLQEFVYSNLHGKNEPGVFGLQVAVNEEHNVLGFNNRLLAGATEISIDRVVEVIHSLGGVAIAAHVDRLAFGILGQLGFIPPGLDLDALELSANTSFEEAKERFPEYAHFAFVRSSDAHTVDDIGRVSTFFLLTEPTVKEIRKAFLGKDGRRVVVGDKLQDAGHGHERTFG